MSDPQRPRTAPPRELAVWAGLLVLYLTWGSTYLAIRYSLESFPPYLAVGLRFLIAGGLLFAWSAARGAFRGGWPSAREWRDSAIVGGLLVSGGMGLVSYAEQSVPSGIAALCAGLIPAWTTLLGRIAYRERVERLVGIGIVVGFVGVAILVGPSMVAGHTGGPDGLDPLSSALIIVAPVLWSIGSLYAAHGARLPSSAGVGSATQMLCGAAIALLIALAIGDVGRFDPADLTPSGVGALLYLATIGGVVAFATYVWLLSVAPLPKVATYAYVNPVIAVILGVLIAGEPFTPITLVAGAVIVLGVALIVRGRGREAASAAERDALLEEAAMAEAEGAGGARPARSG